MREDGHTSLAISFTPPPLPLFACHFHTRLCVVGYFLFVVANSWWWFL